MLIRCHAALRHLSHTMNQNHVDATHNTCSLGPVRSKRLRFPCFMTDKLILTPVCLCYPKFHKPLPALLASPPPVSDRPGQKFSSDIPSSCNTLSQQDTWSSSTLHLLQRLAHRSFALLSFLSAPSSFLSRSAFSVVTLFTTRSQWWHSLLLYYSRCAQWMHRLMKCPHNTDVSLISATVPWPVSHILQHLLSQHVSSLTERWCVVEGWLCVCVLLLIWDIWI